MHMATATGAPNSAAVAARSELIAKLGELLAVGRTNVYHSSIHPLPRVLTCLLAASVCSDTGHPLTEVRTRAFRSLVTKFDARLPGWTVAALAAERELLTRVVGWFNDATAAADMQHDMLNLVAAFAAVRTPSGARLAVAVR